jgi:hypothetical protein
MNTAPARSESLAWRLTAILAPLAVLVAARFRILGPWTVPIWTRLTRATRRLARILASPPATRRSRAPRATLSRGGPAPISLPPAHGFLLVHLKHEAAHYTQRLESLFAEPETCARLAASPAAMRTLRPFCRLLGVALPPALRPPRRPRPARVAVIAPALGSAPEPLAPPSRLRFPSEGCWCRSPASSPFWPFPRGHATAPPGAAPQPA